MTRVATTIYIINLKKLCISYIRAHYAIYLCIICCCVSI